MAFDIDDASDAAQEARSGNLRDNNAGITEDLQVDYDEDGLSGVSLSPRVLLVFDHIARISVNDYNQIGDNESLMDLRHNLERAGPQNYGFDVILTFANPTLVDGQLWSQTGDVEYPDHKIIGDPNDETNPYKRDEDVIRDNGNIVGSELNGVMNLPGGNTFDDSEPQETDLSEYAYVEVKIPSSRAGDVLGQLDTAGQWFHDRDGNVIEGLLETPPEMGTDDYDADTHGVPRLTGYPELREDMVGQRGALLCDWGDSVDATEADTRSQIDLTILKVDGDDELEGVAPLVPDDDAYALPTYPRTNGVYYDHEGSVSPSDEDVGADAEPEANGGVAAAQEALSDGGDNVDGSDDVTLTDDESEFVDGAVNILTDRGAESVDWLDAETDRSFSERVAAEDGIEADRASTLANVVNERL
jgi:hypothetical protein